MKEEGWEEGELWWKGFAGSIFFEIISSCDDARSSDLGGIASFGGGFESGVDSWFPIDCCETI